MSYRKYNKLVELLNGELAAKNGLGLSYKELMDKECIFYLTYIVKRNVSTKVNAGLSV